MITSFGLSQYEGSGKRGDKAVGTYRFMAPEVLRNEKFTKAADVYRYARANARMSYLLTSRRLQFRPGPLSSFRRSEAVGRHSKFAQSMLSAP